MKLFAQFSKKSVVALAAIVSISTLLVPGQTPRTQPRGSGPSQLNLLVLGDSISWGQGLKDEHKAWYQVKTWLETSGRKVSERIEAHSGAVIGSVGDSGADPIPPLDAEVSRGVPSVHGQIDNALRSYADPTKVASVILDG